MQRKCDFVGQTKVWRHWLAKGARRSTQQHYALESPQKFCRPPYVCYDRAGKYSRKRAPCLGCVGLSDRGRPNKKWEIRALHAVVRRSPKLVADQPWEIGKKNGSPSPPRQCCDFVCRQVGHFQEETLLYPTVFQSKTTVNYGQHTQSRFPNTC